MKERGIIVRGGISSKFCLVDGGFAVGEGLIEAYLVESKLAVHPRICLSKDIAANKSLIDTFNKICKIIYKQDTFLGEDNGLLYIDYLRHNLCEPENTFLQQRVKIAFFMLHKKTIEDKLSAIEKKIMVADQNDISKLQSVKDKIVWLKEYHNKTLSNYAVYQI